MLLKFINHPLFVFIAIAIGATLGLLLPEFSLKLAFVGDVYIDFVKMIALPFMVAAILFSLQVMVRESKTGGFIGRIIVVFVAVTVLSSVFSLSTVLVPNSVYGDTASQVEKFGKLVGASATGNDTAVDLFDMTPAKQFSVAQALRENVIPTNVFSSLAAGETLKTLVFCLLFGIAFGQVTKSKPSYLNGGLQSIYGACQYFNDWMKYPLIFVLICMTASQLAKTGLEPLKIMLGFVLQFVVVTTMALAVFTAIIWQRSTRSFSTTLAALRNPFALSLATRSSPSCMPAMIEALAKELGFKRSRIELLVPLSVSLVRIGPVIFYVVATLFVANLYGKTLSFEECLLVAGASMMVSLATVGMSGIPSVASMSIILSFLGLPFEAAFVLFVAIEPISDMCRTALIVIGNCAVVALVANKPSPFDDELLENANVNAGNSGAARVKAAGAAVAARPAARLAP
jgi:Na+/H+-dicarboxylate symporter